MMPKSPRQQRGVALFVLLFIILGAAGALFAQHYDVQTVQLERQRHDREVLRKAKRALINRATLSPNQPGSLVCPDAIDNPPRPAGVADLLPCGNGVGLLPFLTLDIQDLRDSAGERLWYIASPALLAGAFPVINSDVPGAYTVDGSAGIAALVIAPGPALGAAQTQRNVSPYDITQFLEGANQDLDAVYTAVTGAISNDRVMTITVAELMAGAEKRVLRVLDNAWRAHIASFAGLNRFTWLAPFNDPSVAANHIAVPNVRRGLFPLHSIGGNYATPVTINWNLAGPGVVLDAGFNTLTLAALSSNSQTGVVTCNKAIANPALDPVDCQGIMVQTAGLPAGVATRQFTFDLSAANLPNFVDPAATVNPPTAASIGSRSLNAPAGLASLNPIVTVVDRNAGGARIGGGSITLNGATGGPLSVINQHLAPVLLPADNWLIANNWHQLVYAAIGNGYRPGGSNDCVGGCLTLNNGRPDNTDEQALILMAGPPIGGALRPNANLQNYLEDANWDGDDVFTTSFSGLAFNDRVLALRPLP